jgi:hypothetical protein
MNANNWILYVAIIILFIVGLFELWFICREHKSENKTTKEKPLKYRIKATTENYHKEYGTNDFDFAEAIVHTLANRLRKNYKKGETIMICVFDTEVTEGSNLVAQYHKDDDGEGYMSLVSDTL